MTISNAVGIDLGNMFSGVAVWKHDHATLIVNDQGKKRAPSIVGFTKSIRLVGDEAAIQMIENPKGTVYDIKRLTGRHYYDFQVQDGLEAWPFSVIGINGEPMVKINVKRKQQQLLCPEELSAILLCYLKQMAEQHIKVTSVNHCVIAVPVYFSYQQRLATEKAAKLAGLKLLQLIDEPVAAALAYSMHSKTTGGIKEGNVDDFHHVLVVDFGGDYLQVSILNIEQELIKVKATDTDVHLGGKFMTTAMVDDVMTKIKETRGTDVVSSMKWSMRQRLQVACERAKRKLSFVHNVNLTLIDFFGDGGSLHMVINRDRFEKVNDATFTAAMDCVKQTLTNAQLEKGDMEDILLVGGTTHIPKIRQLLTDFFGQAPNVSVRPEEAVALGAAIQAAVLKGDTNGDPSDTRWTLDEVAPLSLGVEVSDDLMDVLVTRGMSLPVQQTKRYHLWNHKQKMFTLKIYQGERRKASGNTLLGTLELGGHLLSRYGEGDVDVTLDLNYTGMLTVKANCIQNRWAAKELRIKISRRAKHNIKRMVNQGKAFAALDENFVKKVEAKQALEKLAFGFIYSFSNADGTKEMIDLRATDTLNWINQNYHATTIEEYTRQTQDLLAAVDVIKSSAQSGVMDPTDVGVNQDWYNGVLDDDDLMDAENSNWIGGLPDVVQGSDADDDVEEDGDDDSLGIEHISEKCSDNGSYESIVEWHDKIHIQ